MERGKRLVVVSHCILNQNTVVKPYGKDMTEFLPFVKECFDKNIGIIQLPCPEFQLYGPRRWGHVKDQFEHQGFIEESKKMLEPIVNQIIDYKRNGYEVLKVYGIKYSPSCGVKKTCRSNWSGETSCYKDLDDIQSRVKLVNESGIFIEIFKEMLKEKNIELIFEDIDDWGGLVD